MRDVLVSENVVGDEMDALKRSFDVAFEPQLFKDREASLQRGVGDCRAIIACEIRRKWIAKLDRGGEELEGDRPGGCWAR